MSDQRRRRDPVDTATEVVDTAFPQARMAFVGGSVLRGEGTPTSDLDLVVVQDPPDAVHRVTLERHGWPVECFVHTAESLALWARADVVERRRPVLARICTEGAIVRDADGTATEVRAGLARLLEAGPPPLPDQELDHLRYVVTDLVDDLVDRDDPLARTLVAAELAHRLTDLWAVRDDTWWGTAKAAIADLRRRDPATAARLEAAVEAAGNGRTAPLVQLTGDALAPFGGRLLAGYRQDGRAMLARLRDDPPAVP